MHSQPRSEEGGKAGAGVLHACLVVGEFVQHTVRGLADDALLHRFCTGFAVFSDSWAWRATGAFGLDRWRSEFHRRLVDDRIRGRTVTHGYLELLRTAVSRLDRSGIWLDRIWDLTCRDFDRWVARQVTQEIAAVYGYEYTSQRTFERAKALGLKTVLELTSAEPDFVQAVLQAERRTATTLDTDYQRHLESRHRERRIRYRREHQLADLMVCNSEFSKRTYVEAGIPAEKLFVIPLGAPPTEDRGGPQTPIQAGEMRVMWAGTFGVRKGAHVLIDAVNRLGNSGHLAGSLRIDVYGSVESLPSLQRPEAIRLAGTLSHSDLMNRYAQYDLLVLPSLCDAFGLVVTEALSRGVPVLTTDCTGASTLIEHGVNGWVIPANNADSLAEQLQWCASTTWIRCGPCARQCSHRRADGNGPTIDSHWPGGCGRSSNAHDEGTPSAIGVVPDCA